MSVKPAAPPATPTAPWVTSDGLVSAKIFIDRDVYVSEVDRIFSRTWLFVAHESEIPNPGDFVTRDMGEDPVIVSRGADGKVRVLLNVCRHRGRRVCFEDQGNAAEYQCPYHGWIYGNDGALTGVSFRSAYGDRLDESRLGLHEAARVDSYLGLIFASWEPEVPSLTEYLGEMTWVLHLLFGRTDGVEVVGPPMKWEFDANWKIAAANFGGDGQHIPTTHGFQRALGLYVKRDFTSSFTLPGRNGHAVGLVKGGPESVPYMGLPEELRPEMERHLDATQLEFLERLVVCCGNIFPNLSFLNSSAHKPKEWGGPEQLANSALTLRLWQPKGPDKVQALTWFFVDKNAPAAWKEGSRQLYVRAFGPAGYFEQDDTENWAEITQNLRGSEARKLAFIYQMGTDLTPDPSWPGPGQAYSPRPHSDLAEQAFYRHWQEMMGSPL